MEMEIENETYLKNINFSCLFAALSMQPVAYRTEQFEKTPLELSHATEHRARRCSQYTYY